MVKCDENSNYEKNNSFKIQYATLYSWIKVYKATYRNIQQPFNLK